MFFINHALNLNFRFIKVNVYTCIPNACIVSCLKVLYHSKWYLLDLNSQTYHMPPYSGAIQSQMFLPSYENEKLLN